MAFPKKKQRFGTIFLSAPNAAPLKNHKFYFYCRLAVSEWNLRLPCKQNIGVKTCWLRESGIEEECRQVWAWILGVNFFGRGRYSGRTRPKNSRGRTSPSKFAGNFPKIRQAKIIIHRGRHCPGPCPHLLYGVFFEIDRSSLLEFLWLNSWVNPVEIEMGEDSTPNITGRKLHRTMENITAFPW